MKVLVAGIGNIFLGDDSMYGLDGRCHCRGYGLGEAKTFVDGQRLAAHDHNSGDLTT